jgi:lipopolysaccharide/colanic/teichoic acid biosynthesis glycosyltransferase/CheY-like chemotaxis protein
MGATVYIQSSKDHLLDIVTDQLQDTVLFIGVSNSITQIVELDHTDQIPFHYHLVTSAESAIEWLESRLVHQGIGRTGIVFNAKWVDDNRLRLLIQINNHPSFRQMPILVVSERIHWGLGDHYIAAGADDYFIQPIDCDRLKLVLNYHWENKEDVLDTVEDLPTSSNQSPIYSAKSIKRLIDIVGALVALTLFFPIMLITAIAIRLESKGPIFYCSNRIGAGFKKFKFWKFRSMYADAEKRLNELKTYNQYGSDATFVKFSNDPRVTKVGKFIRKYSIDELPQLFNVLKGEMSLVGNRPLPIYEADQLVNEDHAARFLAPAGLTGLWQVSKRGHSDMSTEERIGLDVQYSQKHDLWTDFRILFKTLTAFIQKENV